MLSGRGERKAARGSPRRSGSARGASATPPRAGGWALTTPGNRGRDRPGRPPRRGRGRRRGAVMLGQRVVLYLERCPAHTGSIFPVSYYQSCRIISQAKTLKILVSSPWRMCTRLWKFTIRTFIQSRRELTPGRGRARHRRCEWGCAGLSTLWEKRRVRVGAPSRRDLLPTAGGRCGARESGRRRRRQTGAARPSRDRRSRA